MPEKVQQILNVLVVIWLAGVIFGLTRLLFAHWRLSRYRKEAKQVSDIDLLDLVAQAKKKLGMKALFSFLNTRELKSPSLGPAQAQDPHPAIDS